MRWQWWDGGQTNLRARARQVSYFCNNILFPVKSLSKMNCFLYCLCLSMSFWTFLRRNKSKDMKGNLSYCSRISSSFGSSALLPFSISSIIFETVWKHNSTAVWTILVLVGCLILVQISNNWDSVSLMLNNHYLKELMQHSIFEQWEQKKLLKWFLLVWSFFFHFLVFFIISDSWNVIVSFYSSQRS